MGGREGEGAYHSADPPIGDQTLFYQGPSVSENVRLHLDAAVLYIESYGRGA